MQSDRNLLKQALEALELCLPDADGSLFAWTEHAKAVTALRERLAWPEQQAPRPDYRDWDYQDQLEQSPLDRMAENARELGLDYAPVQEPVAHSIVAGALFDFMGWLTTRRERLVLSSSDNAAPAADAIKDFAQMRSLSINDAQVQEWQKHLATPPRREWQGLPPNDLEELIGFHSSTDGYMSEADAKEFARDLEERLKLRNS